MLSSLNTQRLFIKELFYRIFDIHNGEGERSLFMWFYIFFIISGLMIVKPMINALFLSVYGAEKLPFVFILVAVLATLFSIVYSNLLKNIDLYLMINRTLVIATIMFFCFWILLTFSWFGSWILYVIYIFVALFALVTSSQFWVLANLIFNAREAKRLFGFIGSGAIAGGIFGGYLTNFLAPIMGSKNLIFIFLLFLLCCLFIIERLHKERQDGFIKNRVDSRNGIFKNMQNPLQLILSSRHLILIASLVGTSVLVGKLVEYQFSALASEKISEPDELTAFFGLWLSNLNIVTLLVQLFLTRHVVGVFGVGTSLFFLPLALLLGAVTVLVFPELWAAVFIKICDGSLKNSINKSGMELLALPIATDIKSQAKSFIDVFVDSFATGISGLLLFVLTTVLNASTRQVSFLSIAIIIFWLYLIMLIRREYLQSFRLRIETAASSATPKSIDLNNQSILGGITNMLGQGNEKQILQVLRMTRPIQNERLLPSLEPLINHASSLIKLEVLYQIQNYKNKDYSESIASVLKDENLDVRTEAMKYLYEKAGDERNQLLLSFLENKNYLIRSAALLCASRESANNYSLRQIFDIHRRIQNELLNLQKSENRQEIITIKRCCARSIGEARFFELYPFLHYFLQDDEPEVVASAIVGAGLTKEMEFGPVLIQLLREQKYWSFTQTALVNFGADIISLLHSHLKNPYVERQSRLNIPRILAHIDQQRSVDTLVQNLNIKDRAIRIKIIDALYELRQKAPHLQFKEPDIIHLIFEEANDYLITLSYLYNQLHIDIKDEEDEKKQQLSKEIAKARALLTTSLEKRVDLKLERIFRILGLKYPPNDIESAYAGIKSNDIELRINAVEFLDNLLDSDLKKVIVPIAESALIDDVTVTTLQKFGIKNIDEFECLSSLLQTGDNVLKIQTLKLIEYFDDKRYMPTIVKCLNDPDENIRKKAQSMIKKFGL